ncbi:cytochrome P450 [Flagelloscypha sp. PMI_526]|nr:cytochrome P450 [Flagelloscypha sp. PMI_526]
MYLLLREDLAAVAAFTSIIVTFLLYRSHSQRKHRPPGPKSYPLIGSLLEWPHGQEWLTFTKWRDLYGDINYVNVAGTNIVVLNSLESANTLLNIRGTINSDRPDLYLIHDLIGWKNSPILCKASDPIFKPARHMMLSAVGSNKALDEYISVVEYEAHRFVYRLTGDPDSNRLESYLRKLAGTIIMKIVYGYDVKSGHDEYISSLSRLLTGTLARYETPGNFTVDFIPALIVFTVAYLPRWFPGTSWMTTIDDMRARLDAAVTKPVNFVKEQPGAGIAQPSFVARELECPSFPNNEHPNEHLNWTAEALYTGGADTSVSALLTFFLCMVLNPEAQAEAQKELDTVIGQDTLPTWKDRSRLPYTNALIKEVLRWFPIIPEAVPHCSNADDTYNGYFIPKNTILIPNVWGFTHDSRLYPDPESFQPKRFLGPSPQLDPGECVFGFGRRVCAGRLLAESTLFSVVSRTLSTMSIQKKIGADGKPITPKVEYTGGSIANPSPFEFVITPRSEKARSLIETMSDEPYRY